MFQIPDSVTPVRDNALENQFIKDVVIPGSVTSIGSYAFSSNQITELVIPDSVTSIGDFAFSSNQITELVISDSVTSIGRGVFQGNELREVVIPDSVTSIGAYAFSANQLTDVVSPDSATSITDSAFTGNPNLKQVALPYYFRNNIPENSFDPGVKFSLIGINVIESIIGKGKLWGTREADLFTFDQFESFSKTLLTESSDSNPQKAIPLG